MSNYREYRNVREGVQARLALSVNDLAANAILEKYRQGLHQGFQSATLSDPPIASGMTDTMAQLKRIIVRPQPISRNEYLRVPNLIRRMIFLLRVYYNAKMNVRKSSDFRYCDYEDINDVGVAFHEIGLTLHLMPSRLRALFKTAPDMDKLFFDDPLDVGAAHIKADQLYEKVYRDPDADDNDREHALEEQDAAQMDQAVYHIAYLYGDILSAWVLVNPVDDEERERIDKATRRLVEISSKRLYRDALGSHLTDPMLAIYRDQEAMLRFARQGGLASLFSDWADSIAKDGACRSRVEKLPSEAWEDQTEVSLVGVMTAIRRKIHDEGDSFVTGPIIPKVLFEIYTRYGLRPFKAASRIQDEYDIVFFHFILKRISRKKSAYASLDKWPDLMEKYTHIPQAIRRRYIWSTLPLSSKWYYLKRRAERYNYGCANPNCPEAADLEEIKNDRIHESRSKETKARLETWGAGGKFCKKCWNVVYCSEECQTVWWKSHKPNCVEKSAEEKNEMLVTF